MISVVQQLKDHGICPEILPEISNAIYEAKVVYEGGIEVKPGEELAPRQVVQCPTVSWNAEKDTYYTLIFLDPDAPSRTDKSKHCCKHWMVVNIPGQDVEKGTTDAMYVGCGPPEGSGLHRYIFLVYAQPSFFPKWQNRKPISDYLMSGRVPFSAADFARENNLGQPVAANFFQAQYDDSVKDLMKRMIKFPYIFSNIGTFVSLKVSSAFK